MIITLCGSNRFEQHFKTWNRCLTLAGHVCIGLGAYPSDMGKKEWYTHDQKVMLDLNHLQKIEVSDAILLLNVDTYIGESTYKELCWAWLRGKRVFCLVQHMKDNPSARTVAPVDLTYPRARNAIALLNQNQELIAEVASLPSTL